MIPHTFAVQPGQAAKIRGALKHSKGCRIQVRKGAASTNGHQLLVTPAHLDRYRKAPHGSVVNLPFKHEDLRANHRGGFLPLLLAALAPVIGGVAGGLIDKAIAGSGIRWKGKKRKKPSPRGHGGNKIPTTIKLFTVEKNGSGMFLNPWQGKHPAATPSGGGRVKHLYSAKRHGSGMFLNPWPATTGGRR